MGGDVGGWSTGWVVVWVWAVMWLGGVEEWVDEWGGRGWFNTTFLFLVPFFRAPGLG